MVLRKSVALASGQTLKITGTAVTCSVRRDDNSGVGQNIADGEIVVYGPYPRDYSFSIVGNPIYEVSDAPAFEADEITASGALRQEDIGKLLKVNSSDAVALTLPATLPEGFIAQVMQLGTGEVSFAAGSGATMVNVDSATAISGRYGVAGVCVYANPDGESASWVIYGPLV